MNNVSFQAIPTIYKGIKFRSRIEARWSLVMTTLRIAHEYEYQTYQLPTGEYYLPDFYLPDNDVFLEIKGAHPTVEEINKCVMLAKGVNMPVVMLHSGIPYKLGQLKTISISRLGRIIGNNPFAELLRTYPVDKRNRALSKARSERFGT